MAKKFNFRLDPVLRLKTHAVKEQEEHLQQAVGLRIAKENQIRDKKDYHNMLGYCQNGTLSAIELQAQYYHKNFVENEIKSLENDKIRLSEIESLRRQKLSEAMKEEKILVKLKERQINSYKEEVNREETIALDEIARSRFKKNDSFSV